MSACSVLSGLFSPWSSSDTKTNNASQQGRGASTAGSKSNGDETGILQTRIDELQMQLQLMREERERYRSQMEIEKEQYRSRIADLEARLAWLSSDK